MAGEWLTFAQAAQALGISQSTLRRRLAQGNKDNLETRKVSTKNGTEWRILLPADFEPPPDEAPPLHEQAQPAEPEQAMIPLSNLEQLLRPLADERDRLRVERDQAHAEVKRLNEQIASLNRELGRVEGTKAALEAQGMTQTGTQEQSSVLPASARQGVPQEQPQPPKKGWWARMTGRE